jgi:CHAT domain-containing protein/tetratricopeptide (TPR) repeat protein
MSGADRRIHDTVTTLLQSPNHAALRACLLSYPDELLSEHADAVLAQAIEADRRAGDTLKPDDIRAMLSDARANGLLPLLARLAPVSQETVDHVQRCVNADNWHYVFREFQRNSEILTCAAAETWMENLSVAYRRNPEIRSRLNVVRRLANVAGNEGIEGARKWLLTQLRPTLGKTSKAVVAMLGISPADCDEWRELLDLHLNRIRSSPEAASLTEDTIDLLERYLSDVLVTAPPALRATTNLALGELYLFRRKEERAYNRSRAIGFLNDVLSTAEASHDAKVAARAHFLLGKALSMQSTNRVAALNQAIGHLNEARSVREGLQEPPDSADVAQWLGYCLTALAKRTPSIDDRRDMLRRAVQMLEEARAGASNPDQILEVELARAYEAYAEFEPSYLPRAVALAQAANLSSDHPSASLTTAVCRLRYGEIALRQRERDPSFDLRPFIGLVSQASATFASLSPTIEYAAAAELLGDFHLHLGEWHEALAAYETVMTLGDALVAEAFTVLGREETATSQSLMAAKLGYCLCRTDRPERATLQLESTKLRIVLDALRREDLAAADLPSEIRREISDLLSQLRALDAEARRPAGAAGRRPDSVLGELQRRSRQELNQLVAAVSADGRYGQKFELAAQDVLDVVPAGGALLIPFVTPVGTALVIIQDKATAIEPHQVRYLPLTLDQVRDLASRYATFVAKRRERVAAAQWLKDLTHRIWDVFISSVVTELKALGVAANAPVVLVSHAGLGMLPLIAASGRGAADEPLLEYYALTCVPGVSVIAYLRKRPARRASSSSRLLTIVDPRGDLPFARLEAALLRQYVRRDEQTTVVGQVATSSGVADAMAGATHVHFACHAQFDFANPWQSGIKLADGELDASQIAYSGERRSIELVVLSACETGVSDIREAPNEYGGLPAAFLMAGVKAIVSSLWAVNDVSSALLMSEFYRLHRVCNKDIQTALREAQRWLRGATTRELREWLTSQARHCRWWLPSDLPVLWSLWRLRRGLARHDAGHRPFQAVDQWAAFVALTYAQ